MAHNSSPSSVSNPTETTFRSYTREQGDSYAQNRKAYHPRLYQTIIDYHTSTGGQLDTVLDVGCGPGIAVRDLAPYFAHAVGLDPSQGMIDTARSLGGVSSTSEPIRLEVATGEDLGAQLSPPIPEGSIDLITAATAAHWFDMSAFWPRAAKVLKPGGTVALWSMANLRVHPSVPNAAAVQAALDELEMIIDDYLAPGNRLVRDLYVNLPLPWTLATPVPEFDEATSFRKEYNTGNEGSESGVDEFFVGAQQDMNLDAVEKLLGTTSPVTRWREAHPDAVGTEDDVVRTIRRKIEKILHEAGVEKGKEVLRGTAAGVLLVVKRKA